MASFYITTANEVINILNNGLDISSCNPQNFVESSQEAINRFKVLSETTIPVILKANIETKGRSVGISKLAQFNPSNCEMIDPYEVGIMDKKAHDFYDLIVSSNKKVYSNLMKVANRIKDEEISEYIKLIARIYHG
jgi:hypothetical protein